jgi:3-hydroxyacyl-CoA dehydrogenase
MKQRIQKAAVLGAGTMGARIAAHLANAGIPCLLLDIATAGDSRSRNRIVQAGLEAARKSRPASFFTPDTSRLIHTGNFEDDLAKLAEIDWIIEAVSENLEIKRNLLGRVEQVRRPGAIVTTNTSGLPIHAIAEGFSQDFQQHWAGTHFFNPPRYMKLVELIPGPQTLPAVIDALEEMCDHRLGKGVVIAKDTPNFIANRIGTFSMLTAVRAMAQLGMTIEEVDACTGPAAGWPKSATFRTADIVGLDVLVHVVRNLYDNAPQDECRDTFQIPALIEEMLQRGWLGEKTGKGFYQRVKKGGESDILALDWRTMEYRPLQKSRFASMEAGKLIEDTRARLRALVAPAIANQNADNASKFLWNTLGETCLYAARRVPEIADRIVDVDRAMRWGFGWELGPFEIWDALGVEPMARALETQGKTLPPLITALLSSVQKSFYQTEDGQVTYFDLAAKSPARVSHAEGLIFLPSPQDQTKVVQKNSGARLIDIGDGVLCCEFRSKMNAIGGDIIAMIHAGLKRLDEDFEAMVIANDGVNFSVGANLLLLLVSAQEQEWDDLHLAVRQFQRVNMAIKYAPRPVVAAPHGMALGGGCEIPLHAAQVQAAAECYIGLVETSVGLIPAAGGCKEMLIRANQHAAGDAPQLAGSSEANNDLFHALKPIFENIAMAKASTSAEEARTLGYLRRDDRVSMNRDRLLADAKTAALEMSRGGYQPPAPPEIRVLGEQFLAGAKLAVHMLLRGEFISEYDAVVARKLATILSGGALSAPQNVSEQYLLDLEREAFVSLCGERKTQERIGHTLKTGKPLRN